MDGVSRRPQIASGPCSRGSRVPSVGPVQPASLDAVEGTVRRELDAQERHVDAADSHARVVMATAGVFATLVDGGWLPFLLTSRRLAGLAGLAALGALTPTRAPLSTCAL